MPTPSARRARNRMRAALLVLAALGLAALAPGPAGAAPGDHKVLNLRGRVADEDGLPIPDARVEISGSREGIALTGPEGRFQLTVDLGSLEDLLRSPTAIELRASRPGWQVRVSGGEPVVAIEVRFRSERGTPVLEARSNFGIVSDIVLDALAPPGTRTASIQVSFVATRGADEGGEVHVPDKFSSLPVPEAWVNDRLPKPVAEKPAEPKPEAPPPVSSPAPPPIAVAQTPVPVADRATEVAEEEAPKTPSKKKKPKRERTPKPPPDPKPERVKVEKPETVSPIASVPLPAPPKTSLDRVWQAQEAERQARVAEAQAVRDSIWAAQQAAGRARKAMMDSIRAVRAAIEDSTRRARLGLPPAEAPPASATTTESAKKSTKADPAKEVATPESEKKAAARKPSSKSKSRKSAESRDRSGPAAPTNPPAEEPGIAPTVEKPGTPSGLQRVDSRADQAPESDADRAVRARLEADSCTCRVRGTIELEFHRLLTSPLKVEISIREMPALRDTIELFMGSPRAFEMRKVPCGRWSLAVRPFSDRPFGVTTPAEVAPFDCRQRGLRQVRIVLAPTRASH